MSKRRTYDPGYAPANVIAWCDLHNRGMNARYIRAKRCIYKRRVCKHFRWLPLQK